MFSVERRDCTNLARPTKRERFRKMHPQTHFKLLIILLKVLSDEIGETTHSPLLRNAIEEWSILLLIKGNKE